MAGDPLAPANLWQTAPVVTQNLRNPWKPIAIALALLLAAILIVTALVATEMMQLGFSLL
jgi:hypothetical protein